MTAHCPLCGGQISDGRFWMLEDRAMIGVGGKMAQLTSQEFVLFRKLWKHRPGVVSVDRLMDELYQLSMKDEPAKKIVDVFICKVRKKLRPLGVDIQTHWGRGYSITIGTAVDDGWLT